MMGLFSKMHFFLLTCVLSYGVTSVMILNNADEKKEIIAILKKSSNCYSSKEQFQLYTTYKMFASKSSKQVKESFKGYFAKESKSSYAKIDQTEFIITPDLSIKIDNESKLMECSKKDIASDIKAYDLEKYCSYYEGFNLSESPKEWICTLTTAAVSFVPYSKVVIYIDKSDYHVNKQVLYLLTAAEYEDKDGKRKVDYPRLEIEFNNLISKIETSSLFNKNNYIQIKKGKYYPSKKYNSYKVID